MRNKTVKVSQKRTNVKAIQQKYSAIEPATEGPLADALALFGGYIPAGTVLTIEETNSHIIAKYIVRLKYVSKKSGRTMCMMAKGDSLPTCPGPLLDFYLRQIVLTPTEAAREFSTLYFFERRSRQEAFLFSKDNVRVSEASSQGDRLSFPEYA